MTTVVRILVTGSRDWDDVGRLRRRIDKAIKDKIYPNRLMPLSREIVIVHGACPTGADRIADEYAKERGFAVEKHPPKWKEGGMSAGFIRNKEMVDQGADYCLAFIKPCMSRRCNNMTVHGSHGATHCSTEARKAGIKTRVYKEGL